MNYLLLGLGNPGKKYASTRHNAGKMLAAYLRQHPVEGLEALETDCFMNQSGEWIKNFINHQSLAINHYFVAHDDLDLPLGGFKIHFGRGPRLHKGILSIEQALGTKDFWRVRIGIDNRRKVTNGIQPSEFSIQNFLSGEDYVLQPFKREEKLILNRTFGLIKQALSAQFTNSLNYLEAIERR